jgi:hypothetical protein
MSDVFLPRSALDKAIEQVMICCRHAVDADGLRLVPYGIDPRDIERAICDLAGAQPQEPMRVTTMSVADIVAKARVHEADSPGVTMDAAGFRRLTA